MIEIEKYKQKNGVPRFFELKEILNKKGICHYSKSQKEIIYIYYNLCEVTFEYIGGQIGKSKHAVYQMYKSIERKLVDGDLKTENKIKMLLKQIK